MDQHRFSAALVVATVALLGTTPAIANAADNMIVAKASTAPKASNKPSKTDWNWERCDCGWKKGWAQDGIFGPQTNEGVRRFQRHHGLTVDGIAGPKTLAALGLKGRTLTSGAKGDDVRRLQHSLGHHRVWMQTAKKPTPKPSAKPSAKPTPMATPKPTPMPTAAPTMKPTAPPTPKPTMKPTAAPKPEGAMNRPTLELHAADWMLPTNATGAAFTPGMIVTGGGTLWFGDIGIGGDVTMFPSFIASPTSAAMPNTNMIDGDLKWRSAAGWMSTSLGYRGLAGGNYGTAAVRWDLPIAGEWLWLNFGGKGGYNFSTANSYLLDGKAGLDLKFGPVLIGGGYRAMWTSLAGGTETWQAPYAGVGLAF
ncbi:MAG: peptidoglycan-binding protein [Cyanobacteria bacterium RYN_339]|nr:peptidoglycan-binding protein [Cyanobacteria bacterium RYN_339]